MKFQIRTPTARYLHTLEQIILFSKEKVIIFFNITHIANYSEAHDFTKWYNKSLKDKKVIYNTLDMSASCK